MTTNTAENMTAHSPDLTGNGKIFKSLSDNLTRVTKASEDFIKLFGEAVSKKIWMGFVHPKTGELCSFIHRDADGNVDDSLSFKMWVASGQERGGLGIDNFGLIENLLKGNQQIFNQVIPLLIDPASIRQANQIRESQGQPPLVKLNREKEFYLKRITTAPNPRFSEWYQRGLPVKLIGQCANLYIKSNSKEQLEIDLHLDQIAREKANDAIASKLAELFEVSLSKSITINLQDAYLSAKKISDSLHKEGCDNEYLSQLARHLQELAKNS